MSPSNERPNTPKEIKPVEIDRWEGEGGNPPVATRSTSNQSPAIAGILRRLLINWHFINSPSTKG